MKRLYINLFIFLLPVFLLLLFLPVDNRLKYAGLADDCAGHGPWMYNRIYENPKPIDIALIGSSHTISGLDDRLINDRLNKPDLVLTNLGYCRLGRNLSYTILKELIAQKHPKFLILEVREDEDRYSHPIFPYLSNTKEVMLPALWFNRDLMSDVSAHLTYKVELTQDLFYKAVPELRSNKLDYGFGTTDDTLTTVEISSIRQQKNQQEIKSENLARKFYMQYPRSYLQKIKALCLENNIQLYFLYLPSFGSALDKPQEYNTYIKLAPVLLPPESIFDKPDHWHDPNHLNPAGAKALSLWLANVINDKVISQ